jgi:hypothetical protein
MKSRLLDSLMRMGWGWDALRSGFCLQIIVAGKDFANMRKRGLDWGRDVVPNFDNHKVCRRGHAKGEKMNPVFLRSRSAPPFCLKTLGHKAYLRPMFYYKVNIYEGR